MGNPEINEIMNQCITGWRYFPNPRMFSEYGRQRVGSVKTLISGFFSPYNNQNNRKIKEKYK